MPEKCYLLRFLCSLRLTYIQYARLIGLEIIANSYFQGEAAYMYRGKAEIGLVYFAYAKAMITRHLWLSDHVYLCTLEGKLRLELHPQGVRKPQRIIYETLDFVKPWAWGIERRRLGFWHIFESAGGDERALPHSFLQKKPFRVGQTHSFP